MNMCVTSHGLSVVDMNKAVLKQETKKKKERKQKREKKLWLQNIQIINTPGLDAYLSLTLQSSYMMSYVAV